jgi:hypothetical protein
MSKFKESLDELKVFGVPAHEIEKYDKIYHSKTEEEKAVFDKHAHLMVERHLLLNKLREDLDSVRRNIKTLTNITVFLFVIAILVFVFSLFIATTLGVL